MRPGFIVFPDTVERSELQPDFRVKYTDIIRSFASIDAR